MNFKPRRDLDIVGTYIYSRYYIMGPNTSDAIGYYTSIDYEVRILEPEVYNIFIGSDNVLLNFCDTSKELF